MYNSFLKLKFANVNPKVNQYTPMKYLFLNKGIVIILRKYSFITSSFSGDLVLNVSLIPCLIVLVYTKKTEIYVLKLSF